ncbi:MAG: hypothetical protein AL399_06350 [Candidatus [Bacteroides] periocalifornicus]|uniref:Outer membrane protein beta-barrel domain-containing protein n=1 Tax=Candidatus [Bacteroides] periocalifornicus TaxID=1702214 RepID=A0A0Q4B716_9BACT|nr:MAG: hypothetical protein AL399_06350 [Candidatus [Bacteroides] periocalifornicus]
MHIHPPRIFLHKILSATVGVAVFACLFCPALRVQAAGSDEGKSAQISQEAGARFTLERTTFFSESGLPTQTSISLPGIRMGEGYSLAPAALPARGGVGVLNHKGAQMLGGSIGLKVFLPQFAVTYDYMLAAGFFSSGKGSFSVGGYVGFTTPFWFHFDARALLHFNFSDRFAMHLGLVTGVGVVRLTVLDVTTTSPAFDFDALLGFRWHFNNRVCLTLELSPTIAPGLALPWAAIGVAGTF